MMDKIKYIFAKIIDFFFELDTNNQFQNMQQIQINSVKMVDRKSKGDILLICQSNSNLNDIKSVIEQLNYNCIHANNVGQVNQTGFSKTVRLVILDLNKAACSVDFFLLRLFYRVPFIIFLDREMIEYVRDKDIFFKALSPDYGHNITVKKPVSADKALAIFSEYLGHNSTPMIKQDES